MENETYKITFEMVKSMSFIDLPTFDGILSYAFAREKNGDKPFIQKLNYESDELIDFSEMPITRHENGYFIASSMFFGDCEIIEDTQRWRKRWDCKNDRLADFGKNKRKIDISRGQFKSYDMPITTKLIEKCWFYFQSTNVNEVERLLKKWIHFLGKKRSQGYGEIKSFKIETTKFDFNKIYRPIPVKFLDSYDSEKIKYCAWRPPYWLPDNFDNCIVVDF